MFLKPSSLFIRQRYFCSLSFGKSSLIRQTPLIRFPYSVHFFLFWLRLRFCRLLSGCWMIQVMEWCIWQNIQFRQKTQTRVHTVITDHLSYMFMLDRWWLHVNGCSMYIWSNCSCRLLHVSVRFFHYFFIFVMLNYF